MHDRRDERRLTLALFAVAWGANQFTPLLLVYRQRFGFGPAVLGALWGCYAVGLVPGLLLGGAASDARGRRPVVVPFFFLSRAIIDSYVRDRYVCKTSSCWRG